MKTLEQLKEFLEEQMDLCDNVAPAAINQFAKGKFDGMKQAYMKVFTFMFSPELSQQENENT